MRIAILYGDVEGRAGAPPDERAVMEAVEAVHIALRDLGHEPIRLPVGGAVPDWTPILVESGADLVFNLCEGTNGSSANEWRVAAVIELLGLPMTGSPAETLALARRKDRVNALLSDAGIPVPAWAPVPPDGRLVGWDRFPAIIKPAGEDGSVGITQRSVVGDGAALEAEVAASNGGSERRPLLVQEFLPGRELAVGFVGDRVLSVAEIDFARMPDGAWPLVDYDAKWRPGSAADAGTVSRCPARLAPALRNRAIHLARAAWHLLEGRGYGRVDLRADGRGRLHVLDVNPNPDLAPGAGLSRMAAADGWGYTDLVRHIIAEAIR